MCDSLIICYVLPKLFLKVLEECKKFCGFTHQMKPYCANDLLHEKSRIYSIVYSPFCVPAKVIKLIGLKNGGRVSPDNLITFVGTQNGEFTIVSLPIENFLRNKVSSDV
jgi:hypothetical protein